MTNETKKTTILTSIVCLVPILAGILLYDRLPEQIATHWDFAGNANGWNSRFTGAIVFPGILFLVNLLMPVILKMDPKYDNIPVKVKRLIHWIIPAVELFCSAATLSAALGVDVKLQILEPMFLGFLFLVIGNYLPKVSMSYTVGIKIPWTLNDEENWDKTHRMAGFLWTVCGLLMIIGALTPYRMILTMILAIIMLVAPIVYSYRIYRSKKRKKL